MPLLSALSLGASREALNNENKCTRHSQQQTMFAVLTTFPLTVLLCCWLWWEESSSVGRHWTLAPCPEGRVAERGLGRPCMGTAWGELDKAGHTQHSHTHKYAHTQHTHSIPQPLSHTLVLHTSHLLYACLSHTVVVHFQSHFSTTEHCTVHSIKWP